MSSTFKKLLSATAIAGALVSGVAQAGVTWFPGGTIFEDDDVPEKWVEYTKLNAEVCEKYSEEELEANRVTSKD